MPFSTLILPWVNFDLGRSLVRGPVLMISGVVALRLAKHAHRIATTRAIVRQKLNLIVTL